MSARRLGLALGGGAARGWAHVGVLRALQESGLQPDVVAGTSIGALVGAAYAAGELDRFEAWLRTLDRRGVISFLDVGLAGGVLKGERIMDFFRRNFVDRPIDQLARPFAAVATALHTGAEVWLREGSTVEAVRASIALPVLFTPVWREGALLVDGGLVNPVPVSLARAMGADVVIAVDVNRDALGRHLQPLPDLTEAAPQEAPPNEGLPWFDGLRQRLAGNSAPATPPWPSMWQTMAASLNIMQVRITRSRMAGDPPDLTIAPLLGPVGLMDFHRAAEAIEAGRRATVAALAHWDGH